MEQRSIQVLKREFRFSEQGYRLIKSMVFIYAFKKADINYSLYKAEEYLTQDYLSKLC